MRDVLRSDALLRLARQFNAGTVRVEFLRRSHNYIYRAACENSERFILRLTPARHRNAVQIAGELEFQLYLYENGAAVVTPLRVENGEYILQAAAGGRAFSVTAFSWAPGDNWDERCDHTPERYFNIGRELGRIHRLSKGYIPVHAEKRRMWHEGQHLLRAPALFRAYDARLYDAFEQFMDEMKKIPVSAADFGLTHGDYLLSNYMIDGEDRVTVFDFDECEYSWYAVDLAICMHCYLVGADPAGLPARTTEAEAMLRHLLRGYTAETDVSREMIMSLQTFFKMRDFIYFSSILENGKRLGGWSKRFAETCLDRMVNSGVFLEFDVEGAWG